LHPLAIYLCDRHDIRSAGAARKGLLECRRPLGRADQRSMVTDLLLSDWRLAGLRVPSTVRLSRLDCLEHALLIHKLGSISATDAAQVKAVWSAHVKPAF
jgi:hypothetical protein